MGNLIGRYPLLEKITSKALAVLVCGLLWTRKSTVERHRDMLERAADRICQGF